MAQSVADLGTLNGEFKVVYADKIQHLRPDDIYLLDDIPFDEGSREGASYRQPVALTLSHGITFAPSTAVPQLNAAVTMVMKEASVDGYQSIIREQISYIAASRAASSKAAFKNATSLIVESLRVSHMAKLEIQCLYGQMGLGTVSSVSVNTMTLTAATWGPGIWTSTEGMPIDIVTAGGVVRGSCNITSVSLENKTVTVDALPVGTVATDVIYFKGALNNEPAGIHKILANTGSLFGIDASVYNLWRAFSFDCSAGALTFNKVQQAVAKARPKGARGTLKLYVNPNAFADLVNEMEAARHFVPGDSGWKQGVASVERGTKNLKFYGANGMVEVQSHDIVWGGFAYALLMDGSWKRIGSTDVTFQLPGREQGEFFMELENTAGFELRSFADFATFCSKPGGSILFTNIVNSTL